MITIKNVDTLEYYVSKSAMKDYEQVNKKKDGTFYKKHRPYSLSQETQDLQELYAKAHLLYNSQFADFSFVDCKEYEEEVKAKLLILRMYETEEQGKEIELFHQKRQKQRGLL